MHFKGDIKTVSIKKVNIILSMVLYIFHCTALSACSYKSNKLNVKQNNLRVVQENIGHANYANKKNYKAINQVGILPSKHYQNKIKTKISDHVFFDVITPRCIELSCKNLSGYPTAFCKDLSVKLSSKGYKVVWPGEVHEKDIGAKLMINLSTVDFPSKTRDANTKRETVSNAISLGSIMGGLGVISGFGFAAGSFIGGMIAYGLHWAAEYEVQSCQMKLEMLLQQKSIAPLTANFNATIHHGVSSKEDLNSHAQHFWKPYNVQIEKSTRILTKPDKVVDMLKASAINTILGMFD